MQLESEDRLKLLRLVCTMAWADSEVQQDERGFIAKLAFKIGAPAAEIRQVKKWLAQRPDDENFDAASIPQEHRTRFFDACRGVVAADGTISENEKAQLDKLHERLGL